MYSSRTYMYYIYELNNRQCTIQLFENINRVIIYLIYTFENHERRFYVNNAVVMDLRSFS